MHSMSRAALMAALGVLVPLTGCSTGGSAEKTPSDAESASPAPGMDDSLRADTLALIGAREAALIDGDRDAFLATIDTETKDFAETQARWFDNLALLPLTDVSLELGDEGVMTSISGEGDYQLPVDFTMKLDGFDQRPVTRRMVYTVMERDGEVLLSNDRNVQIEARTEWLPAPWDVTDIEVEQTDDVLGIFDSETAGQADEVMGATSAALEVVADQAPAWSGRVTIYTIGDLESLDQMSLMEVGDTGGVAFPVAAAPEGRKVAAHRIMLNPAALGTDLQRDLLLRHELTHVALGTTDDHSPQWLIEGAAEYVAVSSLDLARRRSGHRSDLAAAGDPSDPQLRLGRDFYQIDAYLNYVIARIVCDYLASTRGAGALWDLMGAFHASRPINAAEVDAVLGREIGVDAARLTSDALAWLSSTG